MKQLILFFAIWAGLTNVNWAAQKTTDPVLANKLGITVQELHSLRNRYELTNEQILGLPAYQLQRLMFEIGHPGYNKHREEEEFHVLQMMDEHGHIPSDGLLRALEHRKHMPEGEDDLFPTAPDSSLIVPDPGTIGITAAGLGGDAEIEVP